MTYHGSARAHARLLLLLALGLCSAIVAGCKEEDDGGKEGGGTAIAALFPPIPTDRPDIGALTVTLDVSGGAGPAGQFSGSAGNIDLNAGAGTVTEDDGRALPTVGTNFLTASVLADNFVTFAELIAIEPTAVTTGAGTTIIDVAGMDFHLPAAATLNLGDAPASGQVIIRALGADDVIRIDGTVLGAHPTLAAMGIALVSAANGTAVSVSGSINVSGGAVSPQAGQVTLIADFGDVLMRGTITALGGTAPALPGGNGGGINVIAGQGNILLAPGIWQGNGGSADFGGWGGNISVSYADAASFNWGIRMNGGSASNGDAGGGGYFNLTCTEILTMFLPFELNGGTSTTGGGGSGGTCNAYGHFVVGVLAGSANGGSGVNFAGSGGNVHVDGDSITGVAVDVSANAGNSGSGAAGQGGNITTYTDGLYYVNVLVDGRARGGSGSAASGGGSVRVEGHGLQRNVQLVSDVSGGNSALGFGGQGGQTGVTIYSNYGEEFEEVIMTCIASGGNGVNGGDAGRVFIDPGAGDNNNVTANITAIGGSATTGNGGRGGTVEAEGFVAESLAYTGWSMVLRLSGNISGGSTEDGEGGAGGRFNFWSQGEGGRYLVDTTGTFLARGGSASADGNGGVGGQIAVLAGDWKIFESDNFSFDLRGGDAVDGNGGPGASSGRTSPGFYCDVNGSLDIRGGTINLSGGVSTSGGEGGESGEAQIYSNFGDIDFAATLLINGGDGFTGGGGAPDTSQTVLFTADSDGDGIGGAIRITGAVRANGGNCTGSNGAGGAGGFIWINNLFGGQVSGTPMSGGDVFISGILETAGGDSVGAQSFGGSGGGIEVSSSGSIIEISGNLIVSGGAGDNGGGVSGVFMGCSPFTRVTISGSVECTGGSGPVSGADGGAIELGGPGFGQPPASITVTGPAVIRTRGGTGTAPGGSGFIELDAQGTGGANISVAGGATVEAIDGTGAPVAANVTLD